MSLSINLTINGMRRTIELDDPRVTLLDLLRERLDLTGTKIRVRPRPVRRVHGLVRRSPRQLLSGAGGQQRRRRGADDRGFGAGRILHPVQAAFIAHDAFQCGFCTPGQIISAVGLIREGQADDDPERVREGMSGNLCRCGAYRGITEAVLEAQRSLAQARREEAA
jgi:xanthine dehydrogenase YagT iron-sulfur-binding subunit